MWALPEHVEAAARSGDTDVAGDALQRLAQTTHHCGTDVPLGIEARCQALVSQGATADGLYRESIERLGRTPLRPELARAHLLYGEWLRREDRRVDARAPLRSAHAMFVTMGMEAFAERARTELLATGEQVRKHTVETRAVLTAHERQMTEPRGVVGFEVVLGALLAAVDSGVVTSIHGRVEQGHGLLG
jgi:hypothetical protein